MTVIAPSYLLFEREPFFGELQVESRVRPGALSQLRPTVPARLFLLVPSDGPVNEAAPSALPGDAIHERHSAFRQRDLEVFCHRVSL
ncbi:MAG: hypothetical protein O7F70_04385 [Gemmatimonadetes bacterium]|nr:hypothetical protein [Gemmatimonadota bacterium]